MMVILVLFAMRRGSGPERCVAAILSASLLFSLIRVMLRGPDDFTGLDPILVTIDFAVFAGVLWVALRANRVWPLVIAAMQLIVLLAHGYTLLKIGANQVYWAMMAFPQYIQMVALGIGIFCHLLRRARVGRYRDWRVD
ncbi:hypothetical protein [Novosphingobium album (ex Liu et al. 2023)]|nr:hypothetical protein [Novosphingobium album (ex Liu et al. 2023)]